MILSPLISFGQSLEITVIESKTSETLPFANIYFVKSGVGASSNIDGVAKMDQSSLLKNDSLVVSYIGYQSRVLPYSKLDRPNQITVELSLSSEMLSEAVIEYQKPPRPVRVIKKAIKYTRENYGEEPVLLNSLYRETVKEDGNYIQLNEAIVETYYTGYPQKKLDNSIWKDWYYDETYAFDLEGNRFFYPLLKDFNTKEDRQTILASRHSDNWSKYGIETTLVGDPLLLLAMDKIKYQYDFFNPAILNKYHFKHEQEELYNGELCYVLSFYPKSTNRKFRIDQSRKNKSAIYVGRMYVAKNSFALLGFQYKLAVDRDYGFFAKRIPLDYQVEVNYKKHEDFYSIDRISFEETKVVGEKDNGESILHTANRELHVLDLRAKEVKQLSDSNLFKSTIYSSIRHYTPSYNPDYWKTLTLPERTNLKDDLEADLEKEKSLFEQFEGHKELKKLDLKSPSVSKEFHAFEYHGNPVIDSLHWMASPQHENKLKVHLSEENKYAKNELSEDRKYQRKLFDQLNNFYPREEDSEKVHAVGSYFVAADSLDQLVYFQQLDSLKRKAVFNLTVFGDEHEDAFIKRITPSNSGELLMVQFDEVGVIGDYVSIVECGTNVELKEVSHVYSVQWVADSSLVYSKTDNIGRAGELCYLDLQKGDDELMYVEPDPTFDIEVVKLADELFCTVQSKTENEIHWLSSEGSIPDLDLIKPRRSGVKNTIKYSDKLYLLVNDENGKSFIQSTSKDWAQELAYESGFSKGDYVVDFLPLPNRIVILSYEKSIPKLKFVENGKSKWQELDLDLGIGQIDLIKSSGSNSFSFSFSSPSHPPALYEYSFETKQLAEQSKLAVKNEMHYRYTSVERIWAKGHDGERIPMTILKNRAALGDNGRLILKTYGAYGAITTPGFDERDAILLRQGYTIVYAHVRGGSVLGGQWYKSGRVFQKRNSILDYIACAEHVIKKDLSSPESLVAYGNSAGGLVVAQAVNERPELFNTVVLDHAYLDVLNTMMNDTLPLTVDEYKEWGNPHKKEVHDYILSYSPFQNIKKQSYPNVLLIASYQDYQTPIWQIAKYTAKLRENNTSDSQILMLTDMNSGHIGNTTGKEWIKLFAEKYSFVHKTLNGRD